LLDISKGKWSTVGHNGVNPPTTKKVAPKSLNHVAKKKELQRIDEENIKMMNRIVNQASTVSTRWIQKEYEENIKHKKNLQRDSLKPLPQLIKQKELMNDQVKAKPRNPLDS